MAKVDLGAIAGGFASVDALNTALQEIEAAFENTVSRDGSTPNQMNADLDLNGYYILNQGNPITVDGFNWKGDWDSGTTYAIGDVVYNDGSAYIAIAASTNQEPPNATYWQIVADANLPDQTGNSGKFLYTNGTVASWKYADADDVTYTADGGTSSDVYTKLGEFVSVKDYGADATGATSSNAAFAAAIAASGTVYVPPGEYTLDSNISLSGHWIFSDGAKIVADATVTFTGSINAGEYQIAEHGTGTVVWNIDHDIRAAWLGLLTSNTSTENRTSWDNFIKAQSYADEYSVRIGRGTFLFDAPFYVPQRMDIAGLKMFGTTLSMVGEDEHAVEVCYVSSGTITSDSTMAASHVYSQFRKIEVFCNNMTFTGGTKKFMFYGAGMSSSLVEWNRFTCATNYTNQMDGIFLGPTYASDAGSNHFACLRNTVRHNRLTNFRDGIVLGRHSQSKTVSEPAGGGSASSGAYVGGDCYENTIGPRNYLAGEDTVSAAARLGIAVHYYNPDGYTTQNKPYSNSIVDNSIDQTTNSATSITGTIYIANGASTVYGVGTDFLNDLPNDLSTGFGRYLAIRFNDGTTDHKLRVTAIVSATELTVADTYTGTTLTSGTAVSVTQVMSGVGLFLASTGRSNYAQGNFLDEWCYSIRASSTCEGNATRDNYSAGTPYKHFQDSSDPGDMNFFSHTSATGSEIINIIPSLGFKGPTDAIEIDASGVLTATGQVVHKVDVNGGAAASDDLDTITPAYEGQVILIYPANTARTVVLKDNTGNLQLENDISLDSLAKYVLLWHNPEQGKWFRIGGSTS